jgi:hypothetical protein
MPPAAAISFTSAPVEKARPRPVLTITRTSSSAASSAHASGTSRNIGMLWAFSASGRLKMSQPTGPRRSTSSVS